MRLPIVTTKMLREEVDVALWDLELSEDPRGVVMRFLYRLRDRATVIGPNDNGPRWLRLAFAARRLARRDRGGIDW